jgi:hypothetical protein
MEKKLSFIEKLRDRFFRTKSTAPPKEKSLLGNKPDPFNYRLTHEHRSNTTRAELAPIDHAMQNKKITNLINEIDQRQSQLLENATTKSFIKG